MPPSSYGDRTREKIKSAALQLFAERGVDNVSGRDIIVAAGQKNAGLIHYYFRTREHLIAELVADGSEVINDYRNEMLDRLEASGKPITLHDIVALMVSGAMGANADGAIQNHLRFVASMQGRHRDMYLDASRSVDSSHKRCIKHIRRLLPELSLDEVNQRIVFMLLLLTYGLSMREVALDMQAQSSRSVDPFFAIWQAENAVDRFVDAMVAILEQPVPATAEAATKAVEPA